MKYVYTPITALLLFSILLPSKALTSASDACAAIGAAFQAGQVVPIKSALACVYSFPYDPKRSAAIVDTLYKTFDLHTFKDISIKSPTPEFDVNIDVLESLKKINRTVYQNDFEFNLAAYSVINALNDANAYYLPCYFFAFSSSTAFPLVKILNVDRTGEVVKISSLAGMLEPKIVNATEKHLKIKVVDYAGATLLKINDKDPIAFIEQYAKTAGIYKDLNARINQQYARVYADGSIYSGSMMGDFLLAGPKFPSIKYRLIRAGSTTPETIEAPYFVDLFFAENFTSASDFFAKNCIARPPFPASSAASVADVSKSSLVPRKMAGFGVRPDREQISSDLPPHLQHLNVQKGGRRRRVIKQLGASTNFVKAFILGDRKTGVLFIPYFGGNGPKDLPKNVYDGIFAIKAAGATRLILDVQDSGGNDNDDAYAVFEYLFPNVSNPQYPMQNLDTPFVTKMVQASNENLKKSSSLFNSPSLYKWFKHGSDPSTPFYSSDGYFFPSVPLMYNGKTSQYSSLYYSLDRLGPPFGFDLLITPFGDVTPKFEANQTIILSNGGCFGSCALFSYLMQEHGVKVISVGGSLGKPMAYSTGVVGRSYYLDLLRETDLNYHNLTKIEGFPKPLPVQAFVGYTAAQSFSPQSKTIPADFLFKPADFRFAYTSASVRTVEVLYNQAAKYFL